MTTLPPTLNRVKENYNVDQSLKVKYVGKKALFIKPELREMMIWGNLLCTTNEVCPMGGWLLHFLKLLVSFSP